MSEQDVTPHEAWERGRRAGASAVRRQWSDEPNAPDPVNPYPAPDEVCTCEQHPCEHTEGAGA